MLDTEMYELFTKKYPEASGIRPLTFQEYLEQEEEIFTHIFHLKNEKGWELYHALYHFANERQDIHVLLAGKPKGYVPPPERPRQ